jgi:hypothetical protein
VTAPAPLARYVRDKPGHDDPKLVAVARPSRAGGSGGARLTPPAMKYSIRTADDPAAAYTPIWAQLLHFNEAAVGDASGSPFALTFHAGQQDRPHRLGAAGERRDLSSSGAGGLTAISIRGVEA